MVRKNGGLSGSKRYPEEFKIEAVKQVVEHGQSIADVVDRLGMTPHSLYAWIKRYGPESEPMRWLLPSKRKSGGFKKS